MRYVRPFDTSLAAPGAAQPWLISPDEELGCSIRLVRGDGKTRTPTSGEHDRLAMVVEGEAKLDAPSGQSSAPTGSLVLIPGGAAGAVSGGADACWLEIEATQAHGKTAAKDAQARVVLVDPSRFEGEGFAHQSMVDRTNGAESMRVNVLRVQPGAGSPDFHIHAFSQLYVILEGEMTIDVGRARYRAGKSSVVCLPPGLVHRNFNASGATERHISLLIPEPKPDEIFDFAVEIKDREAELLTAVPA